MSEGSLFWDRVVCGARSSEGPHQHTWRTGLIGSAIQRPFFLYSIVNSSFLKEKSVHERRSREAIGLVSESGVWLREGDLGIEIVYFGFKKSNNELVLMFIYLIFCKMVFS